MIIIYGIDSELNPKKHKLAKALKLCLVETLSIPEAKQAVRFIPLRPDNFFIPENRSTAYSIIEINLMQGRNKDRIKTLIKSIFNKLETDLDYNPIDLEIIIKEQPPHCWGFRGITGDEATDLTYKVDI